MHALLPSSTGAQPDGRATLDARHLKTLRQRCGLSQEAVSEKCAAQRLCLSIASIKRAEAGKPVLYRTARHLAAFYGIVVDALIDPQPASAWPPAAASDSSSERCQFQAALAAVWSGGRGRVFELHGAADSGKSRLLADRLDDARQRGFATLPLCIGGQMDAGAADPLRALLRNFRQRDTEPGPDMSGHAPAQVREAVVRALEETALHADARMDSMPRTAFHLGRA